MLLPFIQNACDIIISINNIPYCHAYDLEELFLFRITAVYKLSYNLFLSTESKHLPIGYIGKVLEGFKLSDKTLHQKKVFPPPELPRHYKPVHVFMKPKDSETDSVVKQSEQNAVTRGLALGEVGNDNVIFRF